MQSAPGSIHLIDEWYDGPRTGVAAYRGAADHYRSLYSTTNDGIGMRIGTS